MSPRLDTAEHVRREQASRIGNLHHPLEPMAYAHSLILRREMIGAILFGVLVLAPFFFAWIGSHA